VVDLTTRKMKKLNCGSEPDESSMLNCLIRFAVPFQCGSSNCKNCHAVILKIDYCTLAVPKNLCSTVYMSIFLYHTPLYKTWLARRCCKEFENTIL